MELWSYGAMELWSDLSCTFLDCQCKTKTRESRRHDSIDWIQTAKMTKNVRLGVCGRCPQDFFGGSQIFSILPILLIVSFLPVTMNNLLGGVLEGFEDEPDDSDDEIQAPPASSRDVEKGEKAKNTTINYMEHFFREVDNIKADIEAVGQATDAIKELHERALSATTNEEEDELSHQLKPLIDATNNRARRTKTLLGLLKEETEKLQAEGTLNASDIRVRENLNNTVTRKFVDVMKLYQQSQQDYKNALKTKAKRQIVAIKPDATDEEVDAVMRTEGGREALMKQAVLSNTVNDQIQTTYQNVAGKYQDVLTLEQSVTELHQMFLDFALLTEQQGELLDQIEYQVTEANEHVEAGNEETVKAIEYQSAVRKKQRMIMGIVFVVTLIIAFIIFG